MTYMNSYDICKRFCHIFSECTSKFFVSLTPYRRLVDTVADGGFQQVSHMSRAMYHLPLGQSLVISVSESHLKTCERI